MTDAEYPKPLPKEQRAIPVHAWMCAECQELYDSEQEALDCYREDYDYAE